MVTDKVASLIMANGDPTHNPSCPDYCLFFYLDLYLLCQLRQPSKKHTLPRRSTENAEVVIGRLFIILLSWSLLWCSTVLLQTEGGKTSLELEDETKPPGEGGHALGLASGRTRSVRSLGTADLIRTQKLKYFEGTRVLCPLKRPDPSADEDVLNFSSLESYGGKTTWPSCCRCRCCCCQATMRRRRSRRRTKTTSRLKTGRR